MNNKVILTDCDGVLLDWNTPFAQWILEEKNLRVKNTKAYSIDERYGITNGQDLVDEFNNEYIDKLVPFRDALNAIHILNQTYGYKFIVISSISSDTVLQKRRIKHISGLFLSAYSIFEDIIILDKHDNKKKELEKHQGKGYYFIEDLLENAIIGQELGLKSRLMGHDYNDHIQTDIKKIKNWQEIIDEIIEEEDK